MGLFGFGKKKETDALDNIDSADCIGCGACASVCPMSAIHKV